MKEDRSYNNRSGIEAADAAILAGANGAGGADGVRAAHFFRAKLNRQQR